ncbi:MAG TPA: hypothetical protein VMA75_02295 [Candidatus Paceibacterota bacterium]|nr:hypothetical protein [Candidatus Paceibacterota bacterium]
MHPKGKVKLAWSPEFAYAIGLLVTDGCLSGDGRHIELTSKDEEQMQNYVRCLGIKNKIGFKVSGYSRKMAMRVQFSDVNFYNFLFGIGLMPRKSKILGAIAIPDEYFFDFLRGDFDGDGTFYAYWDPRWRSSYMFYTVFVSASEQHMQWMRNEIFRQIGIRGYLTASGDTPMYSLKYAKAESLKLLPKMYYNPEVVCLSRKREKIEKALAVIRGGI